MAVGQYHWANNGRGQMRAADVDRDRAVGFLTTAFTEGRLTKEEYDARVETALHARTYADLDTLVTDLPGARAVPVIRARGTNGLAIASLVCGFFPITAIPAIVLGHTARHQIRRTGEKGAGLALVGLMMGWAVVVFGILAFAGVAVFFARAGTHAVFAHPFVHAKLPHVPAVPKKAGP